MREIFLGIETSCDETSMAIYEKDRLLSHVISSSANVQASYGGVVPEVASRYHLKNLHHVFLETLNKANVKPEDITHIVYTAFPGLPGSVHIGTLFAKVLANVINAKLIPVNHLYGHLFSAYLEQEQKIEFPFLGLVVSGGHTTIYDVKSFDDISIINETQDDAIGEVYDKVARILGWTYPGGPIIDKNYDPIKTNIKFVQQHHAQDKLSYSGLKTAVINYVHQKNQKKISFDPVEVASSFQKEIIQDLIDKVKYAFNHTNYKRIVVGGGVSANSLLRKELKDIHSEVDLPLLKYTGDNAAMIVYYGYKLEEHRSKNHGEPK